MTLISIVGDDISRIVPLLYRYREEICYHLLLCDDDPSNYRRAKALRHGMMRFSKEKGLGWQVKIISTNEDSAVSIQNSAQKAFGESKQVWLNATDGYPAITILLADLVRREGGRVLSYDHFDNDLHTIEPDGTMQTRKLASKIDLESYLALLNYTILESTTKTALAYRKEKLFALFGNESLFMKVRKALVARSLGQPYSFDPSSAKEILEILYELGILDKKFHLIPSRQKMLQGDLFEEYIFWLCDALDPDDILLGVKIDFDDVHSEPEERYRVKNEFDILIMHNNRLYAVECKYTQELDGLEFVYKYDAIIDYFGKASKAIIANISPKSKETYLATKASSNFRHSTLRRGRMAGIAVYHESQMNPSKFQNLVRNFFHLGG